MLIPIALAVFKDIVNCSVALLSAHTAAIAVWKKSTAIFYI